MNADPAQVASILQRHKSFVLTTHVNPDGDGLGSEIAIEDWLLAHRKKVTIINFNPTPVVYRFLDSRNSIQVFDPAIHEEIIKSAEVVFVLDTNNLDRLRTMKDPIAQSSALKVCIDHHLNPAPFASKYLLDDNATSTGEIVYHLLRQLEGETLSPQSAKALYCAIMTDTGSFRYPRVDPETHRIVAHLIECGADPVAIFQEVYERWTAGRMQLLGKALAEIDTSYGGSLAHLTITREMLRSTGTLEEDTDNFTTYPMSIDGVKAGILFLEMENGVKISFRSKGDIPINMLAQEFGGGGHMNAAGARIFDRDLSAVEKDVLHAAKKFISLQTKAGIE